VRQNSIEHPEYTDCAQARQQTLRYHWGSTAINTVSSKRDEASRGGMNKGRFTRFEQRIEQLVEGSFARLFAGRLYPREVATHLARAMEDNVRPGPDGALASPNVFVVHLNPDDHLALMEAQPNLVQSLAETVIDLANRGDMRLSTAPIINLESDPAVLPHMVEVVARHEAPPSRSTQVLQPLSTPESAPAPRNAHLIVSGSRYVPLIRPVINIGRRQDNHIVIEDMRVSRAHAQLRLRFGHYVLYDLSSSGGTYVNDRPITECILKPGDVISLAGVALVYIEDDISTSRPGIESDTQIRPRNQQPDEADDPTYEP